MNTDTPLNCPRDFSNSCHLPFTFVTGMVSFFDTIAGLPNYGAEPPNPAISRNDFAARTKCFVPMAVSFRMMKWPMADVLRTGISVRQQEVHIERPDGSRGIALVGIEAVRDSDGNLIGAVNCFQDVTERKRAEEREKHSHASWIIARRTC